MAAMALTIVSASRPALGATAHRRRVGGLPPLRLQLVRPDLPCGLRPPLLRPAGLLPVQTRRRVLQPVHVTPPDDPRELYSHDGLPAAESGAARAGSDDGNGDGDPFDIIEEFETVVGTVEPVDEEEAEVRVA